MDDNTKPCGLNVEGSQFKIYLVGFPPANAKSTDKVPMVNMIRSLVPEACVRPHNIFRDYTFESFQEMHELQNENEDDEDDESLDDSPGEDDNQVPLNDVGESEDKVGSGYPQTMSTAPPTINPPDISTAGEASSVTTVTA
ncbi:hypothetical protein IL306_010720 [Fusarium sp. DS 682]|nr:hypothetical protein IL306_010720 [Fusarium sp. DS 682]